MPYINVDAGALVHVQRDSIALARFLAYAEGRRMTLAAAAPVLTEFLGGSPRSPRARADWVASFFRVHVVDEATARRAATVMREALDASPSASPGAIDAIAAATAESHDGVLVISGDRADFDALAIASSGVEIVDLEELLG